MITRSAPATAGLAVLIFTLAGSLRADLSASSHFSWTSYVEGSKYETTVTGRRLMRTPAWQEKADSPPVSVQAALQTAKEGFRKVVADGRGWRSEGIFLRDSGDGLHWFYVVNFIHNGSPAGLPQSVSIVVLMDGSTVEPVLDAVRGPTEESPSPSAQYVRAWAVSDFIHTAKEIASMSGGSRPVNPLLPAIGPESLTDMELQARPGDIVAGYAEDGNPAQIRYYCLVRNGHIAKAYKAAP